MWHMTTTRSPAADSRRRMERSVYGLPLTLRCGAYLVPFATGQLRRHPAVLLERVRKQGLFTHNAKSMKIKTDPQTDKQTDRQTNHLLSVMDNKTV